MQNCDCVNWFGAFPKTGPAGLPPPGWNWESLMDIALDQACQVKTDVPVGAVMVSQAGELLATAANRVEADQDPTAHAEILAIRSAARKLNTTRLANAILVVTLEPCAMCASAIALSRIAGVVYGASDKRAGAILSAANLEDLPLGGRSFWRLGGVRSENCLALLRDFFKALRQIPEAV